MTRLASWRIVSAKFQACIIPMLLLVLATIPSLLILIYFSEGGARTKLLVVIPNILAVVGMAILFVSTAGMFFSSFCKRTATATAATYTLVVLLGLVSLLILLDPNAVQQQYVKAIFTVNPVATALAAAGYPTMQRYEVNVGDHLRTMGLATAVMVLITIVRVFQLRRTR